MQDISQNHNPGMSINTSANDRPLVSQPQQQGRPVEPPPISGHKELGPVIAKTSELTNPIDNSKTEIMPVHPPEVKIPSELQETVVPGPDSNLLKLEEEIQKSGEVSLAKESTPVITTPTGIIQMPMTYKEAQQKEKNTRIWDSIHWIAAIVMYQWNKYDPDLVKEFKQSKATCKQKENQIPERNRIHRE